jgi:hypothetical protein
MPSITTWQRLEPCDTDDLPIGLQARVHDPLWLLARQWQLGEFDGEDAGSPVWAEIRGEAFPLTRYHPGHLPANTNIEGQRWEVTGEPLETLAEKDAVLRGLKPNLRFSVDAGREFVRLLELHQVGQYRGEYLANYRLNETADADDEAARDFLELMAGRVIDGAALYAAFDAALAVGTLPDLPAIAQPDHDAVREAAVEWLAWCNSQASEPAKTGSSVNPSAWDNSRMEYAFSVSAPTTDGEIVLSTPEYVGGRLDWDAFTYHPGARLGAISDEAMPELIIKKMIPAPLSYRGMPASRWWEFEDARVQLGAARPLTADLASMVLVQFAIIYGNDWFVIPVDLPVGSISQLNLLNVTDSFGNVTPVRPFAEQGGAKAGWKMFGLSRSGPATPGSSPENRMLFLPPAVAGNLEGDPIEEVFLLRDEMANLCWAVESFVESRTGDRIDRRAAYNSVHPPPAAAPEVSGGGRLRYRLATEVPDYWLPFVSVQRSSGLLELERAVLPDPDSGVAEPRSRIVKRLDGMSVPDEEVPRSGIKVTRNWQCARWIDGSTHIWLGNKKDPGRGEGSSGLRFDSLERE